MFQLPVLGQSSKNFEPLRAKGSIPADFTINSNTKFQAAKEELSSNSNSKASNTAKEQFYLESNFLIDQVLTSGRVLFNDTVSNYLSTVLDTVLRDNPTLRKQLRIYAVKSTGVNSFTTNNGIILVNIGLLAQLENEAQLAYIICHEIAHYTEQHVLNAYVQKEELKSESKLQRASFDDKLLDQSQYSKDLEKEADVLGIKRFLRTNYSTSTLGNVFEVMRYAHLPFDDVEFDKTFFNDGFYSIDDSYFLRNVRTVETTGAGRNSKTHPSPKERQLALKTTLAMSSNASNKNALIPGNQFSKIQTICRFELSELYLTANQPVKSIYNSFLLTQHFENNDYLRLSIAKCLYHLSKFKSGGNYGFVHPGFSQIEGESQQLYHMLYRMKPLELCVLATGYLWRLKTDFPENQDLTLMSNDLLCDLMRQYYVPGMFSKTSPPEDWDKPDTTNITSKYDRIRQKAKLDPKLSMITYALVDVFANNAFSTLFDSLEQTYWGANKELSQLKEKPNNNLRQWKNHGFAVGTDKVVVVSPTYVKLDLRKKQQHKFLRSEKAKQKLLNQVNKSGKLLNLKIDVLDQSALDSSEIQEFQDITFLNEWVDARFTDLDVSVVNMPTKKIDYLVKKYQTEYFAWTGVINYRESKRLMYWYLLYVLIPPAIPFAAYSLIAPNYDTYYYCIVFNLKTGEPVQVNYSNFRKRDARDMINSSIYDSFWQMKRKPKVKN